jgi:hypothetical protein
MFENFKNIKDKKETLFTIIIYEKTAKFIIEDIQQKLQNIKKMKDNLRQKIINDRLYNLKCLIEKKYNDKINLIILCGEEINIEELSKKQINILKEYNILNYIFKSDEIFHIDYINNLFYDFKFYNCIHIGKLVNYYQLNSTKKKKIKEEKFNVKDCATKIEEYINDKKENFIIYGNSQINKKINNKYIIEKYDNYHTDEEIVISFQNIEMKNKQKEFNKYISNLNDPSIENKLIYGNFDKFIKKEIENYTVKQLFFHSDMKEKINSLDSELLNFDLIEISTINKGDPGDQLKNDYGGFFGLKYY